jgi:hypothetical protein
MYSLSVELILLLPCPDLALSVIYVPHNRRRQRHSTPGPTAMALKENLDRLGV